MTGGTQELSTARAPRDPRYAPAGNVNAARDLVVGERVKLSTQRRLWKVKARGDRYIILTQPYNPRRTVLYTIIDLELGIRGADNRVFGMGYETQRQVDQNLAALEAGEMKLSVRNTVTLDIEWVIES